MKAKELALLAMVALFASHSALANVCTAVFPGGLQSNASNKSISFNSCGSQLLNNPSLVLSTKTINQNFSDGDSDDCTFSGNDGDGDDCEVPPCNNTACCSASGSPVGTISPGSFSTSSGAGGSVTVGTNGTTTIGGTNNATTDYTTVTVNSGGTLDFSANTSGGTTTYRMNTLTLKQNTKVNLQPGDYWIKTLTISSGGTVTFNVVGSGTARIFIDTNTTINQTVSWNTGSGTSAASLFIYAYGNFTISDSSAATQIKALVYSQGNVSFTGVALTGAVTGENLSINSVNDSFTNPNNNGNTIITYDGTAVSNANFGPNFSSCQNTASQFSVSAPSTGTNCQNMTITVTAQNSSGQTVTNYAGAITLTTQDSTGTWVSTSGGGTFSGGSSGTATYQFVTGDQGTTTFQLSYPSSGASPITIKAYQTNNTGISGLSGAINFIPSSLLVTATAVSNPPASPPGAFSTTETAGNSFTMYLTAYDSSNCGIVTSYTGAKTLRFYTTYVNPTSGTINMTINGTAIASSSSATQTTQSITFTNGVATVTGNYNDAGKLSLNVNDTSSGGPSGASGNFIVIPAQFAINIPSNTATQTTTPSSAAVSACLADAVFKKAGDGFTVNVQPQTAQGVVTPNYGNETSPEGVLLQSGALLAPNPGRNGSANNGAIGNGSSFTKVTGSAGPFSKAPYFTGTNFSFDEVGCINLTASIASGDYLGAGGNISSSIVVGRFTPDHFNASGNTPQFGTVNISSNGSFTYLNQTFTYVTAPILTVTAVALAGTTTQNYTGSFWKLSSSGFNSVYNEGYYPVTAGDTIPSLALSASIPAPIFVDNANGTGTFTFSGGSGLQLQNGSNLSPPLTAELQLKIAVISDSDGVACTGSGCATGGFAFGATTSGNGISFSGTGTGNGKQFLLGRLAVINSLGPDSLALTVPMQTQYYTSSGWVLNTLDSTTTFTGGASSLTLAPSSGVTTTPTIASPYTFQQGVLNISLSAPNAGGYVNITANLGTGGANLPWLEFAWPDTTNNYPIGQATFGVYQGDPRIIYQKENVPH